MPTPAADDLDFGVTVRGFAPGQRLFERYTLERLLGRGGMGVVWLARDNKLERPAALKFMPDTVRLDAAAIDELKRETRRSLDLTHPHIVRIHDFVDDAQTAAIAMEFVDGATVSARRVEQPTRVFETTVLEDWLRQLADALDYAHFRARVVHRDLKPANLMVTRAGQMKVTDFGIARSISDSVSRVSLRPANAISGTLLYMSPQQAAGAVVTVGDDIYSLGATLYELLTGKPPFFSGNVPHQIDHVPPVPLADRRRELGVEGVGPIPDAWDAAIRACLAKDPAGRPASAGELVERLGLRPATATPRAAGPLTAGLPLVPVLPSPAPPVVTTGNHAPSAVASAVPSGRAFMLAAAAVIVLLSGVLGAGGFLLYSSRRAPEEKSEVAAVPPPATPGAAVPAGNNTGRQEQSEAQQIIEGLLGNADRAEETRVRLRRYLETFGADAFYNSAYARLDRLAAERRTLSRQQEQARAQRALEAGAADPARLEETRGALRAYLETYGRDAFYDAAYARADRLAQEQADAARRPSAPTAVQDTTYRPPPPPPSSAPGLSAQDVGNLIVDNMNALQRKDLRAFVSAYADRVSWFEDGSVNRDYIFNDKVAYFKIWDSLRLQMTQQIRVFDTDRPDVKRAEFTYHFTAANSRTGKVVQGDSTNTWTVQRINGTPVITATREQVNHRRTLR